MDAAVVEHDPTFMVAFSSRTDERDYANANKRITMAMVGPDAYYGGVGATTPTPYIFGIHLSSYRCAAQAVLNLPLREWVRLDPIPESSTLFKHLLPRDPPKNP